MKTRPFGVITWFITAYGDAVNHSEYFRIQDRGKFVKCDGIYQNKDGGPLPQNGVFLASFEELVLENYAPLG